MGLLYWLEDLRTPWLDTVMSLVTRLGEETVFMAVAVIVFWCVSKNLGYYLLTVGFLGTVLNQFLKLLFRIPRPWVLDPEFTVVGDAKVAATGYSFPSGHTQNAVGTFGAIARWSIRHRWLQVICVVIALLVGISRMYLGVHTPLDVGVSLLVAAALVFLVYPIVRSAERNPCRMLVFIGVMVVLSGAYLAFVSFFPFPADIDGENLASGVSNAWKLLGASAGLLAACWADWKYLRFETVAVWWVQILKVVVGLALVLAVKAGLKAPLLALIGHEGVASMVRYLLLVLVAGILWPMCFGPLSRLGRRR